MKKYNKFHTVYVNARKYTLLKKAGALVADQLSYDKETVVFKRLVYQTFRQEVQMMLNIDIDRNPWVFDQNELIENGNGKESLKSLCKTYYCNLEALYLSNTSEG